MTQAFEQLIDLRIVLEEAEDHEELLSRLDFLLSDTELRRIAESDKLQDTFFAYL